MILKSIQFTQDKGQEMEWQLFECPFAKVNLIVGKNASGKTKTLNVINSVANLLSRARVLEYKSGDYVLKFDNKDQKIEYVLKYEEKKVIEERLKIDSKIVLKRTSEGKGTIKAIEAKIDKMKFQVSDNQLATVAKRDAIQHPFLEDLYKWADSLRHFHFGGNMGKDYFVSIIKADKHKEAIDLKETKKVIAIFLEGFKEFGEKFVDAIKKDMATIGYDIENISTGSPTSISFIGPLPSVPVGIIVKESDLPCETDQHMISQGMFRALSLIIQFNYAQIAGAGLPNCILVDDIGEGLDFERARTALYP